MDLFLQKKKKANIPVFMCVLEKKWIEHTLPHTLSCRCIGCYFLQSAAINPAELKN